MPQRIHLYAALMLISAFLLSACSTFQPRDELEGIAYVQEKLDTALTAIETAYASGAVTQAEKNRLLDRWQHAKDAEDAALRTFAAGGPATLDNATTLVRVLLRELVRVGLLEEDDQ